MLPLQKSLHGVKLTVLEIQYLSHSPERPLLLLSHNSLLLNINILVIFKINHSKIIIIFYIVHISIVVLRLLVNTFLIRIRLITHLLLLTQLHLLQIYRKSVATKITALLIIITTIILLLLFLLLKFLVVLKRLKLNDQLVLLHQQLSKPVLLDLEFLGIYHLFLHQIFRVQQHYQNCRILQNRTNLHILLQIRKILNMLILITRDLVL